MKTIKRGTINTLMLVAEDFEIPSGVLVLAMTQPSTGRNSFCQIESMQSFDDWHDFEIEEVATNPDPSLGQMTLQPGDYTLKIYNGSTYTTVLSELTELYSERSIVTE